MIPSPVAVEPFTAPVGPQVPTSRDPLEMFSKFFDESLLSEIVRQTNLYTAQCLCAANSHTTWETNVAELRAYIGFHVLMGIQHLPEIRDYWSTDPKLRNEFISSRITRDRFKEISRYLHFVDNVGLPLRDEPGYHRLQKVLPIINIIKTKFRETYCPHQQNTIDKAMILHMIGYIKPLRMLLQGCAMDEVTVYKDIRTIKEVFNDMRKNPEKEFKPIY